MVFFPCDFKYFATLLNKTLATFTFISLLLILLGINRGFDFSDEGLYALLAVPEQQNIAGIFNYDLFFKLFFKLTGLEFGIVGLRLLRLTTYVIAAFSLTVFWRNFKAAEQIQLNTYFISFLGLIAGYAFLPQSLSYNSLTVFWASLLIACLSFNGKRTIHFLLLAFALAALFYIKITVCFTLSALSLSYLLIRRELTWKSFLTLLFPLLFLEFFFYLVLKDCGLLRITGGFAQIQTRGNYEFFDLLKYTAVGMFWVILVALPFVVLGFIDSGRVNSRRFLIGIGTCVFFAVCYLTSITEEWNHVVLLSTMVVVVWQAGYLECKSLSDYQKLWLGILLLLPFLLHFGSNVYWLRLGIHYWVFWVIVLRFIYSKKPLTKSTYLKPIFGLLVVLLIANGIWIKPFEQEPLWEANINWEYKPGKKILLSIKQLKLMEELSAYTQNKKTILSFYRIPGLSYLQGKTIVKSPGYWDKKQLEFYFPYGISEDLILYHPYDSLPAGLATDYQKKLFTMPNGEELQLLWRE